MSVLTPRHRKESEAVISFAREHGRFSYLVTHKYYCKLADRIVMENLEVTGYGRFQSADLVALWDLPFIKIFEDGDHMCALVGANIQEGVAEFTPLVPGKKHFDQITDHGLEYARAHKDTRV